MCEQIFCGNGCRKRKEGLNTETKKRKEKKRKSMAEALFTMSGKVVYSGIDYVRNSQHVRLFGHDKFQQGNPKH